MATQTTTFYTPQQQLHMDAFEWWSNKNHGFVVDYAYIDTTAPTYCLWFVWMKTQGFMVGGLRGYRWRRTAIQVA